MFFVNADSKEFRGKNMGGKRLRAKATALQRQRRAWRELNMGHGSRISYYLSIDIFITD